MFEKLKLRKSKKDAHRKDVVIQPVAEVPEGSFMKCDGCDKTYSITSLKDKLWVCPNCDYHFRMHVAERVRCSFDTFQVFNHTMKSVNPLQFPGYQKKLDDLKDHLGVNDAVVSAEARIGKHEVIAVVMDTSFMMGSMGSVVGEKITQAFERATKQKKPIIIFSASGGARMQEGILSLMQMAKTSAAVGLKNEQRLFINVLTDPTTGGVSASFAMLADIILAEPRALVGFAGPRVIEQTIKESLPEGFQRSEFLLEKGFIDAIVHRHMLKEQLIKLLELHEVGHG